MTVNDVVVSFDPSVLIAQLADDAHGFKQQDPESVEAFGQYRMWQKTAYVSLSYSVNLLRTTGIEDAVVEVFRCQCLLSNLELLECNCGYGAGLRIPCATMLLPLPGSERLLGTSNLVYVAE